MAKQDKILKRSIAPENKQRDVCLLEGTAGIDYEMNSDRHLIGDDLQSYINEMDRGVSASELARIRGDLLSSISNPQYRAKAEALLDMIDGVGKGRPFPIRNSGRVVNPADDYFG